MLATLDENEEVVDGGKKGTIDDLQQGELESFIQNLNLAKYSKSLIEEDEPEKKENTSKKEAKLLKVENKKQKATEGKKTSEKKVKNKTVTEKIHYSCVVF